MSTRAKHRVDYGHLIFVLAALGFVIWFMVDAWTASSRIENLMLIVPTAVVATLASVFILVQEVRRIRAGETERDPITSVDPRIPLFMAAMSVYVVAMVYVGFDVATFVFLAASLWLLGERNAPMILGYSAAVTAFSVFSLRWMLSVPVPTLLFGG